MDVAARKAPFRIRSAAQSEALARVRAWTQARFRLLDDETVLVTEIACGLAGCPPIETVVVFWTADGGRHQFKVFKPVQDVTEDDLPFAWLKGALAAPEGFSCDCC